MVSAAGYQRIVLHLLDVHEVRRLVCIVTTVVAPDPGDAAPNEREDQEASSDAERIPNSEVEACADDEHDQQVEEDQADEPGECQPGPDVQDHLPVQDEQDDEVDDGAERARTHQVLVEHDVQHSRQEAEHQGSEKAQEQSSTHEGIFPSTC